MVELHSPEEIEYDALHEATLALAIRRVDG
jgi:hypothetical protein